MLGCHGWMDELGPSMEADVTGWGRGAPAPLWQEQGKVGRRHRRNLACLRSSPVDTVQLDVIPVLSYSAS